MLITLKNLPQILENLEQGLAEDGSMTNVTQENRQGTYSLNIFFFHRQYVFTTCLSMPEVFTRLPQSC